MKPLPIMDLLVSSISSSLAYGIGRMSVVNSRAFFPAIYPLRVSAGLLLIKLKLIVLRFPRWCWWPHFYTTLATADLSHY